MPFASEPVQLHNVLMGAGRYAGQTVDVTLGQGRIQRIQPCVHASAGHTAARRAALLMVPGFVNAHAHSNECFEAGAYEGGPLELWLAQSYPPLGGPITPARWHYLRAVHLARQCLRSGVSAVHDDFLNNACDPEALEQVMQAYEDVGIRARVAITLVDRPYLDGLPHARALFAPHLVQALDQHQPLALAQQLRYAEACLQRYGSGSSQRVGVSLGPRGPQRCSSDLLRATAELCLRHGAMVHMHVLETRTQAVAAQHQHARTWVAHLHDHGLLNAQLVMNHGVWLSASDVDLMAAQGAMVAHNPLSNFKLSSGLCPLNALHAAGVRTALGTDGAATGDSLDYLETLRFAALAHKLPAVGHAPVPAITAAQVLRMAWQHGQQSMGLAPDSADFAEGAVADFTLMQLRDPSLFPLNDIARQLCYSASSRAVHSVYVGGECVYAQGQLQRIAQDAIDEEIAEAFEAFQAARQRLPQDAALHASLQRVVAHAARQAHALPTVNQLQLC